MAARLKTTSHSFGVNKPSRRDTKRTLLLANWKFWTDKRAKERLRVRLSVTQSHQQQIYKPLVRGIGINSRRDNKPHDRYQKDQSLERDSRGEDLGIIRRLRLGLFSWEKNPNRWRSLKLFPWCDSTMITDGRALSSFAMNRFRREHTSAEIRGHECGIAEALSSSSANPLTDRLLWKVKCTSDKILVHPTAVVLYAGHELNKKLTLTVIIINPQNSARKLRTININLRSKWSLTSKTHLPAHYYHLTKYSHVNSQAELFRPLRNLICKSLQVYRV